MSQHEYSEAPTMKQWNRIWAPATKGGFLAQIFVKNPDNYVGAVRVKDQWVPAEWDLNGETILRDGDDSKRAWDLVFQGVMINGQMLALPDGVGPYTVTLRFEDQDQASAWKEALKFV